MPNLRNLILIGAGGFGREVLQWARHSPDHGVRWRVKGFIDDNPDALVGFDCGAKILSGLRDYIFAPGDIFLCAIGRPTMRRQVYEMISTRGGECLTLVHPTAIIADSARLGSGVVVCPFALVSVNASIEDGTAIYYHTSVDHDVRIGRYCQISAHCDLAGGVVLDDGVFMGSHATILPGIRVGHSAVVGAGAVVTKNVAPQTTVMGVPARSH